MLHSSLFKYYVKCLSWGIHLFNVQALARMTKVSRIEGILVSWILTRQEQPVARSLVGYSGRESTNERFFSLAPPSGIVQRRREAKIGW